MSVQDMGGLYATVGLEIGDALKALEELENRFKRALRPTVATRTTADSGAARIEREAKRATAEVKKTAEAMRKVDQNTKKAGESAKKASKEMGDMGQGVQAALRNLQTTAASLGAARSGNWMYALSGTLGGIGRGFTTASGAGLVFAGTVGAITAAVVASTAAVGGFFIAVRRLSDVALTSATELETLMVSFEAMLGEGRAKGEFRFLTQLAQVSPFLTDTLVRVDRLLIAQGMLDDQFRHKTLQSVTTLGAAFGMTNDGLQNAVYALGQVNAAGRLTGDEMRQLTNNMLGVTNILGVLPEYANKSGQEIKKMVEQGAISSETFFKALNLYAEQYDDVAEKQRNTLSGLREALMDAFQIGLGDATRRLAEVNSEFSVLGAHKDMLRELVAVVDEVDFTPLAASLGYMLNAFLAPITNWFATDGEGIRTFLQVTLPNAITTAAYNIRLYWTVIVSAIRGALDVVRAVAGAISQGMGNISAALGGVGDGAKGLATVFAGLVAAAGAAASGLIGIFAQLAASVIRAFGGMIRAVANFMFILSGDARYKKIGENFATITAESFATAQRTVIAATKATQNAITRMFAELAKIKRPELPTLTPEDVETGGGGGGRGPDTTRSNDGAGGGAKRTADEMARAMDTLYEMMRRWFETRSELEKGFLGDRGFEATLDSIVSTGKRVIEVLADIDGTDAAISAVESTTSALMDLARRRDEAAELMREAEQNLASVLRERDNLARQIADQARRFALSFKTETDTVRKLEQFSERGFFYETEVKKQRSFLESLRERAKALFEFQRNLEALRSAGLNADVLREIAAAGPEAAGEAAAEVAAAGPEAIREINSLYADIAAASAGLGESVSDAVFGDTVSAAQALVGELTAHLDDITAAAEQMVSDLYALLAPWAKEMEGFGDEAGGGIGSGVTDGMDAAVGAVGGGVATISTALNDAARNIGAAVTKGVNEFGRLRGAAKSTTEAMEREQATLWERIAETITNIWETDVVQPLEKAWAELKDKFTLSAEDLIVSVAKAIIRMTPISVILPFVANNRDFRYAVIDAVNDVIRLINSISWLPDIPLLSRSGGGRFSGDRYNTSGGGGGGGGAVAMSLPPSAASWGASPQTAEVHVYLGDREITDIVRTEVRSANSIYATRIAKGA